jgi:predicted PurR-regulated permease PerM
MSEPSNATSSVRSSVRAALVVLLVVVGLLVVRFQSDVFFIVLAGWLFSIFLQYPSGWISRRTGWPRWMSLAVFVILLLATIALSIWSLGAPLADQFQELLDQLPRSVTAMRRSLGRLPLFKALVGSPVEAAGPPVSTREIVASATDVLSRTIAVVVGLTVTFFIGLYGAAQPDVYERGLLRMIAPNRRPRAAEILRSVNHNLARWLAGRIIAMASVAVLTAVGLLLAGIPLAIPLGIMAGLFTFIEYVGAVVSAVPAVAIGLQKGALGALWVVVIFVIAHIVEGYLMTPVITRGTVRFPPAFTLGVQLLFGSIFGVMGLTFATPVTVVAVMLIENLYVEDRLGDREAVR